MMRRKRTELRDRGPGADHGRSDHRDTAQNPNPWLAAGGARAADEPLREAPAPTPPATAGPSLAPQPGMVPAPREAGLPRVTLAAGASARVWWVGAHGGAGESTLARLLAGSRAGGHAWPLAAPDTRATRPPVVLVARTHASGLRAAQAAATEWAAGLVPVRLLGLVLIADAPGRPPRPLRELAQLVAGGVPAVWRLPWHEPWRLGELIAASSAPPAARALLEAIAELAPPVAPPAHRRHDPDAQHPVAAEPPRKGVARA
jgi:hypothetical protein